MRAISLWQPWASLVVEGKKRIETRDWYTGYRGPLLIHAAKRTNELTCLARRDFAWALDIPEEQRQLFQSYSMEDRGGHIKIAKALGDRITLGAIIGTVQMVDCKRVETFEDSMLKQHHDIPIENYKPDLPDWIPGTWTEGCFGNYAEGRFGWVFENPVKFPEPVPYKGSQGFFDVAENFKVLLELEPVTT